MEYGDRDIGFSVAYLPVHEHGGLVRARGSALERDCEVHDPKPFAGPARHELPVGPSAALPTALVATALVQPLPDVARPGRLFQERVDALHQPSLLGDKDTAEQTRIVRRNRVHELLRR